MTYFTDEGKEIVSIDNENPDFHAWGRNCCYLGYDIQTSNKCLDTMSNPNDKESELFWLGYFYNK